MRPLERRLLGSLRARALGGLPAGARLIEVGAGTGANFHLYPAGATGVACEPSREMIERARGRIGRPEGIRLVRCHAERLPFADQTFDAGLATLVLCSVEQPRRALSELRRVVRPGGLVILLEHVRPDGLLGHAFDALSLLTVALIDDHFNRRTADDARRVGLNVMRVERHALGIVQIISCRVDG